MHTLIFEQLMGTKMRKFINIICGILLIFSTEKNLAQCPLNNFTSSDTICPLQNLNIDNSQSTALSFNWDFCLGDLDSMPLATALPSISGTLSYPLNMKMVEEGGNFYGFIVNVFNGNYITRYDFGNSPSNTPTAVNLNSDPLLGNSTTGIDMVKEGNKWYMFLVSYGSNSLLRYDMDSITQLNPTLVNLNLAGLTNPYSIKIIDDYAFITNNGSTEITRISFGGSYLNTPTSLLPVPTGFLSNFGIDIAFDCVSNKYIGYTTASGSGTLTKMDFGNSLGNTPTTSTEASALWTAQGLQLVKEEGNWHIFIVTDNNNFYHFTSGNSLDLPLNLQYTTNFGGIMANPQNIQMSKVGSDWIGIMPNKLLFSIVRLQFPQGCNGVPSSSTSQSPTGISFPAINLGYSTFELKETLSNGNSQYYLDSVFVKIPPPEAFFSFGTACKNSIINFTDSSTICYGSIIGWNWDFGDGNSSTLSAPSHTYSSTGSFLVTFTVFSSNGDSAFIQKNILIHELPVAWFTILDSACVGSDVVFIDSTISNDGNVLLWNWNFGDGNSGAGDTIIHAYSNSGFFTIELISSTEYGCVDTSNRIINITPGPISDFQVFNTCAGEIAQFNNFTTATGTSVQSTLWNFGDSNTSLNSSPSHAYPSVAASYNVELISTAINGCTDTIIRNIRIANQPLPWFTTDLDTACSFSNIQFTDSSFAGVGDTISKRIWDFGDGIIDSTTLNPVHIYNLSGLYTVTLTIQSPDDCDSSIQRSIFVIESPTANFSVTNVCLGGASNFIDLSTSPSGSILTEWSWEFGDTNTSIAASTTHTYNDTGYYDITLIVKSDIGCYDTLTSTTQVYSLPVVWFTHSSACTDNPVQFTDSSMVTGSSVTGWNWDFGSNGGTSTSPNPIFTYNDPLAFPVTLIATSAQGCLDTITRIVIASQSPDYSITTSDHCFGTNQAFVSTPAPGSNSSYTYLWNFGDSTASFLPSPLHNFSSSGSFAVNLLVTDLINGCSSLSIDTVIVHSLPTAGFSNSIVCVGSAVQFNDTSVSSDGIITSYNWNLGTSGNSTQQNPSAVYNSFGTQNIKLTIQTSFGCKDSTTKSITVNALPTISIAASPNYGAPPLNVQFANTSSAGSYNWQFGDGSPNSSLSVPSHVFNDTGVYQSTLMVTNAAGCIDSSSVSIYVQIPLRDLSVNGVSFNKVNNKWIMKAIVANLGNEDAKEFELKANLSGEQQFYNEFKFDTLKAGTFKEYTFNTTLDAGNSTPPFFCVEVISINDLEDMNSFNDRFCRSHSNSFEIFNAYPNPFNDQLYLGINMINNGDISISLLNINGSIQFENKVIKLDEGLNTINLAMSELANAVYVLKVNYKEEVYYIKIVKN